MPEGPEVTILAENLNHELKGKTIIDFEITSTSRYRDKAPDNFVHFYNNLPLKINGVKNKGKLIYFLFDKNFSLLNTLGMSGGWSKTKGKHTSVIMTLKGGKKYYFIDTRHFGTFKFFDTKGDLDKRGNDEILLKKFFSLDNRMNSFLCKTQSQEGQFVPLGLVFMVDGDEIAGFQNDQSEDYDEALARLRENMKLAGTRNKAGSFGDLKYPKDMNGSQDFMMFTLLEYKPKDLLSGDSLGTGERARVGFNKDGGGRKILGTCSLPIQSGIKDTNSADWGENKMNAMQLIAAEAALAGTEGPEQAGKALDKIANVMGENSGVAKEAIQQYFAGKMTGSTGLFARTKGATINPNLELLFNGPTLRPFSFQFRLSPRNKLEAQEVVRIIRFFKQGMSPIRTEGNLFLLAPHTFQVHFVHAPTSAEHPFIGKMKECALKTFSTDYTPENNYSTLKDGFMASYSITMEFQELEPVYNDDYRDDEDSGFSSFREDPAENAKLQNTLPAKIGF